VVDFWQIVAMILLVLKTAEGKIMEVEVFIKPDGSLCRIADGAPVLPVALEREEDDE
jgi:hypothetical protein